MIVHRHLSYYQEIFSLPGFLSGPILCFGFQEFEAGVQLEGAGYADLGEYFATKGIRTSSLDLFDPRSDLRYDMNFQVPANEHGRYGALIDIGSIEHVFDTRQCFENCLRMVALGGHYLVHTPVNGYYAHGFHVFNPECLLAGLDLNGFRVIYHKFSAFDGTPVQDPAACPNTLVWIVGKKEREMGSFVYPQQGKWFNRYA
jgi:hypothetical protein